MKNAKIIKEKIDELFKEIDVNPTDFYLIMKEIQKNYWFSMNYHNEEDILSLIEEHKVNYDANVYDKKVTLKKVLSKITKDAKQYNYDDTSDDNDNDYFVDVIHDIIDEIQKEK